MKGFFVMGMLTLFSIQSIASSRHPVWGGEETNRNEAKRPVTVSDAIRMTKLGAPSYWNGASSRGLVAQFSPDGKKFVVVLRRGKLEENTNEYSMLLWRTNDVFRSPAPTDLLTMSSSSNRPAIHDIKWLLNGEKLQFVGEQPGQRAQLYQFDIATRKVTRVTNCPFNLLAYSITPEGQRIAYVAEGNTQNLFDKKAQRYGLHVSTQDLYKLLIGQEGEDWGQEVVLFLQSGNGPPRLIKTVDKIDYEHFSLSPDGKYLVALCYVTDFPKNWKEYADQDLQRAISENRGHGQYTWITRYELIDTTTGVSRVLLDAPQKRWKSEVVWAQDSKSVVIANSYLPLTSIDDDQRTTRKSKTFVAEVKVPSGEITPISQEDMTHLAWGAKSDRLFFEWGISKTDPEPWPKESLLKVGGHWETVNDPKSEQHLPRIILEEDMNTFPRIVAVDPDSQKRAVLLELNPQFKALNFGRVEEIVWKSSDGLEVKGGLYYPVDYVPGKKYPLVIQTHGWTRDKFWIDGPWTTSFAAQPLAGKGIMVLQSEHWSVEDAWWSKIMDSPEEVDREVGIYERAIDYLDERGMIDSNRVGIMGFSRTCLYVKYALTHSAHRFAAASITDGVDAGYFQYIIGANNPGVVQFSESVNGGRPFGEGLRSWVARSAGFGIERVTTPVRIVAPRKSAVLEEWEWFAALTRLGKPVDMMMMEDGEHLLQKPWERLISQEGNVDWFVFWLKDEEDPEPSKVEQYVRWRKMREQLYMDRQM